MAASRAPVLPGAVILQPRAGALPPRESLRSYILFPLILLALGAALGVAAYRYYQAQKTALESSVQSHLSAIADLKVQQVLAWRRERLGAAVLLAANPMVSAPPGARDDRRLRVWLEDFRKLYGYSDLAILDDRNG